MLNPKLFDAPAFCRALLEQVPTHFLYLRCWEVSGRSWYKIGITSNWKRRDREQNVLPVPYQSLGGVCLPDGALVKKAESMILDVLGPRRIQNAHNRELLVLDGGELQAVCRLLVEIQNFFPQFAARIPKATRQSMSQLAQEQSPTPAIRLDKHEQAIWRHVQLLVRETEGIRDASVGTFRSRRAVVLFELSRRDPNRPRRRAVRFTRPQYDLLEQAATGLVVVTEKERLPWEALVEVKEAFMSFMKQYFPTLDHNGRRRRGSARGDADAMDIICKDYPLHLRIPRVDDYLKPRPKALTDILDELQRLAEETKSD